MSFTTTFPQAPALVTPGTNSPTAPPTLFPVAPLIDFDTGDLVYGSNGALVWADAVTAWQQRFLVMVLTRRGATPIYPPQIGNTFDLDERQKGRAAQEKAVQADITAIGAADPYTAKVDSFVFAWQTDGLYVTFTVTSVNGDLATLTTPKAVVAG